MENLEQELKLSRKLNKRDKLYKLNEIAQELANEFTEQMSILEDEIQNALDNTGEKIKEELGYFEVSDVTQDINVTASWEY
jgi:gas vesicle protein